VFLQLELEQMGENLFIFSNQNSDFYPKAYNYAIPVFVL